MKLLGLSLVAVMLLSGCATFQRAEVIETDKLDGYASGEYRDNSSGRTGTFGMVGSAYGWGTANAGGGGGVGALGLDVKTGPPPSGAYVFAKSIAMINYSKKLKSITYDETGRIIEYQFDQRPLSRSSAYPPSAKSTLPQTFGFQPVE